MVLSGCPSSVGKQEKSIGKNDDVTVSGREAQGPHIHGGPIVHLSKKKLDGAIPQGADLQIEHMN